MQSCKNLVKQKQRALAAEGKTVVFVSSYLPELLAVCDRIGVMARGKLREIKDAKDWTEDDVMATAIALDDARNSTTH